MGLNDVVGTSRWEPFTCLSLGDGDVIEVVGVLTVLLVGCWGGGRSWGRGLKVDGSCERRSWGGL